jgi:DNA (cytosine-5)-methyltransferase 1
MKLISLFAGIGGFDLGFDRSGFETVATVEKDASCRKLLAARWPDAVHLDDVCSAGACNLPSCDVITFGFPCQDLSVAGKRAGLAGGHSGLFYEATRIIDELKPTFCLFENVPGLLSSDEGRDFARVLTEMDRIGYHGSWRVLDAQYFGVAQRRRRVFGLFSRLDSGAECCAEILSLREGLRGHPAPSREAGQVAPTLAASGVGAGRTGNERNEVDFCIEAPIAGTLDGKRCAANHGSQANESEFIVPVASSGRGYWNESETASIHGTDSRAGYESTLAAGVPDVTRTLRARGNSSFTADGLGNDIIPEGAGCLQERDAKGCDSDTKPRHLIPVAYHRNASCAVTAQDGVTAALRSNAEHSNQFVGVGMSVRRLAPTECERLQGFPDGWTEGFADTVRYRMLGNAVAVPVAEWIASRIAFYKGDNHEL